MADKIKVILHVQANGRGTTLRKVFEKEPTAKQVTDMLKAAKKEVFR